MITPKYVALVEDDPAIAEMYGFGLATAGYKVAAFPDGTSLLASLDVGPPDVLVLDWMLPSMNADTLLERLRADARTRDLRILILSNLPGTDHGEIDVAFAAGVLAWLEKSKTTPACLADRIREALAAREEVGASL